MSDSERAEKQPKTQKEKKTKKRPIRLVFSGLLCAGFICLAWAGYLHLTNNVIAPPDTRPDGPHNIVDQPPLDDGVTELPSDSEGRPVTPAGRREGVYTIILAGTDMDDVHTDVLMVAALDTKNKKLDVLSIPRDTQVAVKRANKKINGAWGVGMNARKGNKSEREAGAIQQLRAELKTVIGFVPDAYAVVDLKGFKKLVDAMGGVEFDVPQNMRYSDPVQDLYINLKKGRQVLDGDKAMQLVRFRRYNEGDMKRVEVQQAFLTAVFKQLLSVKHIFKLPEFAAIAQENLRTDLGLGQMIWFGQELMKLEGGDIVFHTLPGDPYAYYRSLNYVLVYRDEALKLINGTINPFTKQITEENVNISHLRDDGK
jgi:LCP family protein required for cell wall assembly